MSITIDSTPIDIEITRTNNNVDVTTTPIEIEVSNADRNVSVETKPIDISIESKPIDVAVSTVGATILKPADKIYWKGIITFTAGVGSNTATITSQDNNIGVNVICQSYDKTITIFIPEISIRLYHVTSFDVISFDNISGFRIASTSFNDGMDLLYNEITETYDRVLFLQKSLPTLKVGERTVYICVTFEMRIP